MNPTIDVWASALYALYHGERIADARRLGHAFCWLSERPRGTV